MSLPWSRIVAAGFIALWALPHAAVAQPSPRPEFEGYVFSDVDGVPLPDQSDEAIERILREGQIVSREKIPVGVTHPRKLVLAYGDRQIHASFKEIDRTEKNKQDRGPGGKTLYRDWRDWYGYEIAAYRLDRLLGLYRVPPTVERRDRRSVGAVAYWVQGSLPERERQKQGITAPDVARFNQQRLTLRVFDNLIANRDSNLGNMLIDGNWRLWFIDFSRSFGTSKGLIYPEAVTHCERRLLEALRSLDRDAVERELGEFLTRFEIDALMKRRDKLVEHIDGLIAEQGGELVLFDNRPPSERAPWADE
ncbi:MAG: hypothetical protein PVG92_01585 [Holophagae bacterium]|jgi:hypothetical protein